MKLWRRARSHFTGPKPHKRMKNRLRVIFRFDLNVASLWWRTRTSRGARSSWSWTPSSLVLLYFTKLPHPGDLVTSQPAFSDEPETIYEGCYETEDNSIFAWCSVLDVGHYRWLRGSICRVPLISKADYLVRNIRRILDFLQLWTMA